MSLRRSSILSSEHRLLSNFDDGIEATVGEDLACRICGDSGTESDPLFHPCRCTGSIRYIHEPCLLKWLAAKSGSRLGDNGTFIGGSNCDVKCELCGSPFEFSTEYSQEYSGRSGLIFSVWLGFDIMHSLLRQSWQRIMVPLRWLFWVLAVPVVVGLVSLWLLSVIAQTGGTIYDYHVADLRQTILRIHFVGAYICIIGAALRERVRPRQDRRSWSDLCLTAIVGIVAGLLSVTVPYQLGLLARFTCKSIHSCDSLSIAAFSHPIVPALSDFNQDAFLFTIGFILISFLVILGQGLTSGPLRLVITSTSLTRRVLRSASFFTVPLLLGRALIFLNFVPNILVEFINRQTRISQTILVVALGCTHTVPCVIVQRFVFNSIFHTTPLSYLSRICLYGRQPSDSTLNQTLTVIRASVQLLFLFAAVVPAISLLKAFQIIPLKYEAEHFGSSPLVLPFELFYAHILVPLVLNVPDIPTGWKLRYQRIMENIGNRVGTVGARSLAFGLFLATSLVFASTLVCIGLPVSLGRLFIASNDVIAFSIGFLILLITLHAVVRIANSRISEGIRVTRLLSALLVGAAMTAVLPVVLGAAFHITLILPLRRVSALPHHNAVIRETQTVVWTDAMPLWVMGAMLLKIAIALASIGAVTSWRIELDVLKRVYDSEGILGSNLHKKLIMSVFLPVLRGSVLFCFVPYAVLPRLGVGDIGVSIGWLGYWLAMQGFPRTLAFLKRHRDAALVRRNLLRNKLRNYLGS